MNELTPSQAALIARGVYRLREDSVRTVHERGQSLGCEELFHVSDDSRFQGKSGSLAWKQLSGFGYIAEGKGRYQGDILLVTRGTAIGVDWLTNFNVGMQLGPSGHPVHAGFHETWKSIRPAIQSFLQCRNPTTIHCVGHSLGGALATLSADHLSEIRAGQIKLYTFGTPRAGSFVFSRALTRRIGSENIFRVSHPSDPVPLIPIFPFQHVPHDIDGMIIANDLSGLINLSAHSMEPSYIPGVEGKTWHDLILPVDANWEARAKTWLDNIASNSISGFQKGSAKLFAMIGKALLWLLKKSMSILVGAIGTAFTLGATLLDQLAWIIGRATEVSVEIAGYVKNLISAIFKFLGRTITSTVSITVNFLRWVLELLTNTVSMVAIGALSITG